MPLPSSGLFVLSCLLAPAIASAQNFLPLDFSQNVQQNNAIYPNNSTLGPEYYSGTSLDFLNVTTSDGTAIDARVTVLGTSGSYEFVGWIPGYGTSANDLGFYYRHTGDFSEPVGGVSYGITFYEGGGTFTTKATLSNFRLLIYDHDGEPGQSESIRTHVSDGFTGYQIYDGSGIHTHHEDGSVRFDARGENHPETGPDGSFIAYYQNTSSVRFDLFATTDPSNPAGNNGIFAGFAGSLDLTNGQTDGFGAFVPVPEPTIFPLASLSVLLMLIRRNRDTSSSRA